MQTYQIWNAPGTGAERGVSMRDRIVWALSTGQQVWLTGHSMGGAIATTAAALLLCGRESRHRENLSALSVTTFNAPRALRPAHAERYDNARQDYGVRHHRIEHRADPVPSMPPGYEQVGDSTRRGRGVAKNRAVQVAVGVCVVAGVVAGIFAAKASAEGHAVDGTAEESSDEEEN